MAAQPEGGGWERSETVALGRDAGLACFRGTPVGCQRTMLKTREASEEATAKGLHFLSFHGQGSLLLRYSYQATARLDHYRLYTTCMNYPQGCF